MSDAIGTALLAAQRSIEGIEKDSSNSFHKYKYASGEAIIADARRVLHEAGLTVSRHRVRIVMVGEVYMIRCVMRLQHMDGSRRDDTVMFPVIPEKGRPLDKAAAGSLTTSLGYYLRDLLCVPRVDEQVDVCGRDDRNYVVPRSSPKLDAAAHMKAWTGMAGDDLTNATKQALAIIGYEVVPGQMVDDETWLKLLSWVKGNKNKDALQVLSGGEQNGRIDAALTGDS